MLDSPFGDDILLNILCKSLPVQIQAVSPALLLFLGHAPAPQGLSCSEGPKTEHSIRGMASPVPSTCGTIAVLLLLATLFLIQARMLLAFLATWAHSWRLFSWLFTNSPGALLLATFHPLFPNPCSFAWGHSDPSAGPSTQPC